MLHPYRPRRSSLAITQSPSPSTCRSLPRPPACYNISNSPRQRPAHDHPPSNPPPVLPAAPTPPRPRASRLWPIALVAIVFLLLVGLPVAYLVITFTQSASQLSNAPTQFLNSVAHIAAPKIDIRTLALSTVADVQRQSKLVVLQTTVNAQIERSESASSWGVYWGTNTARVVAEDVRVQYIVDLRNFNTSDIVLDETRKTLTLHFPKPALDESMISIDPTKIKTRELSGGWLRWDKATTHDRAIAELRPQAAAAAQTPLLQQESERAATEALQKLLRPLSDSLSKDGLQLEIRFR